MSTIAGLTRADLDQFKRNLKEQSHQKTQSLNSLKTEVEILLKGMQKEIESVSEKLQAYQGHLEKLDLSLKHEFNGRSQAVQTTNRKISKTIKEVKELQEKSKLPLEVYKLVRRCSKLVTLFPLNPVQ